MNKTYFISCVCFRLHVLLYLSSLLLLVFDLATVCVRLRLRVCFSFYVEQFDDFASVRDGEILRCTELHSWPNTLAVDLAMNCSPQDESSAELPTFIAATSKTELQFFYLDRASTFVVFFFITSLEHFRLACG